MKLKLDEQGHVVVQDGKPVYVHDDGKEVPFDAAATVSTISRLNAEARDNRVRAEKAEEAVKQFEGISDPAAAIKALNVVKNLDDKKLVDAGEVDKVKEAAIKAVEEKYAPIVAERDKLQSELYGEKVGGNFARSQFIKDKLLIPADLAQAAFGNAFKVVDGKVVAYDKDGREIFSRANPGNVADFDEALEILVTNYPHKDSILKGAQSGGSGSSGAGNNAGGKVTVTRAQFQALSPEAQASTAKQASEGKVVLTD